jgi:hypothetical protein
MHGLETTRRLNREACEGRPPQSRLRHHPRIQALRAIVNRLPVDGMYRAALHRSLGRYADQWISRPHYRPEEGWDDLEALQQVTLGDMMEESLRDVRVRDG